MVKLRLHSHARVVVKLRHHTQATSYYNSRCSGNGKHANAGQAGRPNYTSKALAVSCGRPGTGRISHGCWSARACRHAPRNGSPTREATYVDGLNLGRSGQA